jgi:hypothetical protein
MTPTILVLCPWIPNPVGLYRPGNDLVIIQDISLNYCQNDCLGAQFDYQYYNPNTQECTLHYNLGAVTIVNSRSECNDLAAAAQGNACNTLFFVPGNNYDIDGLGTCTIKYARSGDLINAGNTQSVLYDAVSGAQSNNGNDLGTTYDFNCISAEPSVTPTTLPSKYYPPVCVK